MGVATAPRPLAPTPRLRGRPRVRSVELTRRNHATVLFSDGSRREVHTPSLDQRTDEAEWLAVRAALEITASEFAAAKDEWRHASRDLLLRRKLGDPAAQFRGNAATAFGTRMEPRAVRMYERVTGHAVEPTGLHMHDNLRWGASPDGIVTTAANETGLLDVKCSFRHRERRLFTPSCREQACSRSSAPSATGGEAPCRSCKTAPPSSSPRSKASSP